MPFADFYALLTKVYVTLLHVTQRASIIHELIFDITKAAETSGLQIGVTKIDLDADSEGPISQESRSHQRVGSIRRRETEDFDDLGSFADLPDFASPNIKSKANLFGDFAEKAATPSSLLRIDTTDNLITSTFAQNIQDSSDKLFSACELSHIRCAKLLTIRSDQNLKLNSLDFFRLYGATWEYLAATEAFCGRMCFPLKGCISSQAKFYIQHFHDEKSKQIAILIENEQWVQADIPFDFQHITEQLQLSRSLAKSGNVLSMESINDSKENLDEDSEIDLTSTAATKATAEPSPDSPSSPENLDLKTMKFLLVDGNKYYVVGSVLLFLKSLTDYVNCAEKLQILVPDIVSRVFELLKVVSV
jgi:Vps54-like protein